MDGTAGGGTGGGTGEGTGTGHGGQGIPVQMGTTCRRRTWPFTCRKRKPVTCPQPRPTNGTRCRLLPTRPATSSPRQTPPLPPPPCPARASGAPAPAREPGQTGRGGARRVSRDAEEFLEAQLRPQCAAGRARAWAVGNGQWAMGQAALDLQ
ncbi:hypothetical protein COCVIDRAFT_15206 [Bipolaris victoriae FI3]|uniref:Uncharacterized protein n=1 Tax=Bipolaris victoriae (strain FI3) TaxID=930091 RepID=W7EPX0_BIPV3|nr:hypothetical protein COCVIDRAFT_15206 [Bipolaris victoriae FI3]